MANDDSTKRMDALKSNAAIKRTLTEFFKDRLLDHQDKLIQTSKENFDVLKGKCIELRDLLKYLES